MDARGTNFLDINITCSKLIYRAHDPKIDPSPAFHKIHDNVYKVCLLIIEELSCIATEPPAKRDCQFGRCGLCQREPKVPGLYKKHTATQQVMPEMRLETLDVCLTDRRLNQLS